MDTVEGGEDSACLLTLLHRPSRLQLALPLGEKTAGCVADALGGIREVLGADGMGRVFGAVLTDNGAEFSDEGAIAALIGEGPGRDEAVLLRPEAQRPEGRLRAKPRRDKEAAAQGRRIRFDRLAPADLALAMSHVDSPRRRARLLDARARLQGDARGGARRRCWTPTAWGTCRSATST